MCDSVSKADLLSDHFNSKQSRESVDLPLTSHGSINFMPFAFRSSEVNLGVSCYLDLDPFDVIGPLGICFQFFLREQLMSPPLVVAQCSGGFFAWVFSLLAEDKENHPNFERSIVLLCCKLPTDCITPILSKVFERLVS